MNRASEEPFGSERAVGGANSQRAVVYAVDFITEFRAHHHISVPHTACGGACCLGCCVGMGVGPSQRRYRSHCHVRLTPIPTGLLRCSIFPSRARSGHQRYGYSAISPADGMSTPALSCGASLLAIVRPGARARARSVTLRELRTIMSQHNRETPAAR